MTTSTQLLLGAARPRTDSRLPAPVPRAAAARCSASRFTLEPQGAFCLQQAALFGFGQRHEDAFDGCMRLCFCLDGYEAAAGVVVTQDARGLVHGEIAQVAGAGAETEAIAAQVMRVLS